MPERVVVVGAGFAGLAAADALSGAGIDVVVLEARARVGGRVWSHELESGATVEMGAEFILPGNDTIRAFVERFGLELWDKGMLYGNREPRGGLGVSASALHDALAVVAEALQETPPGMSAGALLDSLSIDPGARDAIRARLEVSTAATADRAEAGELTGIAAHSADVCPSIAHGNQRIAQALAAVLGPAVRLASPVEHVGWDEGAVRVRAVGAEVEAERIVLAVPASVIDQITFEPPLPAALQSAYAGVEYGNAAKLFVPLLETAPPSAVLSVTERYWTWTATGAGGVEPVVNCFAGSAPALGRLGVSDGPSQWLDSLRRLRPELALDPDGAVLSTWDDDPWVRAAYSCQAPPASAWTPVGPFHVCGEHTVEQSRALMDGALASGLRAAREILGAARVSSV